MLSPPADAAGSAQGPAEDGGHTAPPGAALLGWPPPQPRPDGAPGKASALLAQSGAPVPQPADHTPPRGPASPGAPPEAGRARLALLSTPSPAPAETHPPLPRRLLFSATGQGAAGRRPSGAPGAASSAEAAGAEGEGGAAAAAEAEGGASKAAARAAGRRVVRKKPGDAGPRPAAQGAAAAPRGAPPPAGAERGSSLGLAAGAAEGGAPPAARKRPKAAAGGGGAGDAGAAASGRPPRGTTIGKRARAGSLEAPPEPLQEVAACPEEGGRPREGLAEAGAAAKVAEVVAAVAPPAKPATIGRAGGGDVERGVVSDEGPKKRREASCKPCRLSCKGFPLCCVNCPMIFAMLVVAGVPALMGVLFPGIIVDTDLDTLLEADGNAQDRLMSLEDALVLRGPPARRLQAAFAPARRLTQNFFIDPNILHKIMQLRLLFRARSPGGMLTYKALDEVRQLEARLRGLPGWRAICGPLTTHLTDVACDPGISLVNSLWPVEVAATTPAAGSGLPPSTVYNLTGRGTEPMPLDAAVALVFEQGLQREVFPRGWSRGDALPVVRTVYEFNMNCCSIFDPRDVRSSGMRELTEAYSAFVAEELYPTLLEFSQREEGEVELFWEGNELDTYETMLTLKNDAMLAIGSFAFILVYLTLHTRSFFLSVSVLFLTALSIPAAFVTSAVVGGTTRVTAACFLSLFLIAGFGVDSMFVFVAFWNPERSGLDRTDVPGRIRYMWKEAGMACLATSMTTAASFFANLASVIRPLREFGFFMGMCLMWVYILLACCLPALLVLRERCCAHCWRSLCGRRPCRLAAALLAKAGSALEERLEEHGVVLPQGSSFAEGVAAYTEHVLVPWRWPCAAFWVVLPLILLVWTAQVAAVDGGMPQVFPEGQNGQEVGPVAELFAPQQQVWPLRRLEVCDMGATTSPQEERSKLNWCPIADVDQVLGERPPAEDPGASGVCVCVPTARQCTTGGTATVTVATRFVGLPGVAQAFWASPEWGEHVRSLVSTAPGTAVSGVSTLGGPQGLGDLVQEHWETGLTAVQPFALVRSSVRLSGGATGSGGQTCYPEEVCYCGAHRCTVWGQQAGDLGPSVELAVPQEAGAGAGRRLDLVRGASLAHGGPPPHTGAATPPGAAGARAAGLLGAAGPPLVAGRRLSALSMVTLVWGLQVRPRTSLLGDVPEALWEFDAAFQPEAPSVQRFLLNASRSLSAAPELRVLGEGCWIEYFKSWLRHSENQEFPVRASQFQHYVSKFAYAGIIMDWTSMPVGDAMWFNENSELVATMMDFSVPFSFGHSASADLLAFKEQWDGEIAALSHRSPIGTGDMWGTSRLWIRAEAEQAIIYSTMNTMIVSSACAFAGALFFTRFNLPLSVLVFLTVSCVTICLAWFMSAVLGWLFGVVQVLGLIIFVGYSITYSIHIAAKYSELTSDSARSEADHGTQRREAVTQTLHAMSSPIMGSAVTTLGASFFLFFCRLQIFVKLATVLFTVTFFALVYALVALPAVLLCVGPLGFCGAEPCRGPSRRARELLGIAGSHRRLEDSRRSGEDTELQDPAAGLGALGDLPGELVWQQPAQGGALAPRAAAAVSPRPRGGPAAPRGVAAAGSPPPRADAASGQPAAVEPPPAAAAPGARGPVLL